MQPTRRSSIYALHVHWVKTPPPGILAQWKGLCSLACPLACSPNTCMYLCTCVSCPVLTYTHTHTHPSSSTFPSCPRDPARLCPTSDQLVAAALHLVRFLLSFPLLSSILFLSSTSSPDYTANRSFFMLLSRYIIRVICARSFREGGFSHGKLYTSVLIFEHRSCDLCDLCEASFAFTKICVLIC